MRIRRPMAALILRARARERLRGRARWEGDPLAPVVDESDIEALKK